MFIYKNFQNVSKIIGFFVILMIASAFFPLFFHINLFYIDFFVLFPILIFLIFLFFSIYFLVSLAVLCPNCGSFNSFSCGKEENALYEFKVKYKYGTEPWQKYNIPYKKTCVCKNCGYKLESIRYKRGEWN